MTGSRAEPELYSTQPDAFDRDATIIATVLATHTTSTLIAAAARERAENLSRALISNRRIGMAIGCAEQPQTHRRRRVRGTADRQPEQ